jgi:urate oxidase
MSIPQMLLNRIINSSNVANNPMAQNILGMAKNGDVSAIEQFGRNIARERGVDFDEAFQNFRQQFSK